MAYEAVDSLQQTLRIILQRHDDHVITPTVKQHIVSIHDKAVVLQFNLKRFPEKETIREVAIASEGIIQYLFSPQYLSKFRSRDSTARRQLSDELQKLAKKLESSVGYVVDYCNSNDLTDSDPAVSSSSIPPSTATSKYVMLGAAPTNKDVLVGFDEDMTRMRRQLIGRRDTLKVLPIVGMAGIGKSTLAKYVYDHPMIMEHFDIRAWVTISQDYDPASISSKILASLKDEVVQLEDNSKASILSIILASLKDEVDQVGKDSFIILEAENLIINKILSRRRYLIVMDDMWSAEAWDHIRWCFPEHHNGSRIILTTRLMDVATRGTITTRLMDVATDTAPRGPIHKMHFLDDEQSWRLFNHKVFGEQDCPLELQSAGEKIVKGCGGLPLSIVTVAGLLSRIPRTPKLWQQIEVNDGQLGSILSLSYNHLPPHLRKCFLYMAGFPQDYDIHSSELIRLWVAEGFFEIYSNIFEIVELEAKWCLEDLVKQSLVLVTSRKSNGNIKSCRLHSMVRDFCVRQAGQEKLLLSVMDYLPTPILRRHFLPQVLLNHHRVSVSWHDLHLKDFMHSSCTTSIICIPQRGYRPKGSVENFTSLRVLHLLRRNDYPYWELGQVFELINLTHLASTIPDGIVPPAIVKLQNLQTLIIYGFDVHLPEEIWRLRQLRHLIAFSFRPLPLPRAGISLENLQTLSIATNFVCSEWIVFLPSIRKLGICYSEEKFGAGYYLDNPIHLLRLEKLKLKMYSSSVPHPYSLSFPLSLKKLELSGLWIAWINMTTVGSLPNLEVLKLKNYACYGEQWETTEGEFRMLIHLLIDESNLKCWRTKWTHFPRLQCLMLHRCPFLDEIPHDIGTIPSLELIEIDDHSQSLLNSANKIQAKHRNDGLKVVVKRS